MFKNVKETLQTISLKGHVTTYDTHITQHYIHTQTHANIRFYASADREGVWVIAFRILVKGDVRFEFPLYRRLVPLCNDFPPIPPNIGPANIYTAEKPYTITGQQVTVNRPVTTPQRPIVPVVPKPVIPVAPQVKYPANPVPVRPQQPFLIVVPSEPRFEPNPVPVKPFVPVQPVVPVRPVQPLVRATTLKPIETGPIFTVYPNRPLAVTTSRPFAYTANKYSTPGPAYLPVL